MVTLDMDLTRRKTRLIELLDRFRGGEDVAPRDIKAVLTEQQFVALQASWTEQQQLRADAVSKPAAVVEYEARLRKALFEYGKAEAYNVSKRRKKVVGNDGLRADTRAYRRAETGFEKLIEYLEERVTADPSLCMWFDRQLVFGPEGNLGLSPQEVPRVVTSRSMDREGEGWLVGMRSKRAVKQAALEDALASVEADIALTEQIAVRIAEERAEEEQVRQEQQQARMNLLLKRR